MVVQVCWWCPQCHKWGLSHQTSTAPQFHRFAHQIHHRAPRRDGLPFLDTLTKPTHNSIESTLTIPLQQNYLLSTTSSTELNKYVLHLNSLQKKWITFTKSYKTSTTQHSSFKKANPNRKPTKSQAHPQESLEKKLELSYHIKNLSEQYRYILEKYKDKEFSLQVPVPSSLYSCIQKV